MLVICLIAVWPFLSRAGLPQNTDAELHIFRLAELSYLVRGGEFYPRWAANFYYGYGYPIFNYYAPLVYYVGLMVDLLPRLGPVAGIKAVLVLGLLTAAFGTYGFVRDNWGRRAGYVAAAVCLYAPYMQYIDPHARGAVAEAFSFGMFPLALWALDRLRQQTTAWRWVTAVFTTAAVVLSHNLMGMLFFAFLLAWASWQFLFSSAPRSPRLLLAVWLGFGCAAFFWLPVLAERNAVNLNMVVGQGNNYDFHNHFLSWAELLTFSRPIDWGATLPAFRFNLGIAQWVLGGLGVVFTGLTAVPQRRQLHFLILSLATFLFLLLPVSTRIWETIPFLPFFQFPWRLLGAVAILLGILAGVTTYTLLQHTSPRWQSWITAVLIAFPLLLSLPLSQPVPWPPFGEVNRLRVLLIEQKGHWLGTTSTADYVPATVDIVPQATETVLQGFYENTPLDRVNRANVPPEATVQVEEVTPLFTRYHINTPRNFRLRLYQFDFPGWQVRLDNGPAERELARPEGTIVVLVPAGEHVVEVEFTDTPARQLAWGITLVSLGLLLLVAWRVRWQGKVTQPETLPQNNLSSWAEHRPILWTVVGITAVSLFLLHPSGWLHYHSTGFVAQPTTHPTFVNFGDQIALLGFDAPAQARPGDTLEISLYWKAQQPLNINFQSFLHVLHPDGNIATQSDHLNPGDFPTRRWPMEQYVLDVHTLQLPADLPPGDYAVTAGLWVQAEGWRLPVQDDTGQQLDDKTVLFYLRLAE